MRHDEELLQLITRFQRPLLHYISRQVPRDSNAEDVLQEVNLVIWRRADEYRHGTDFGSWAFKIASFQIMAFRQKWARDRLQFSDELLAQLARNEFPGVEVFDRRRDALQHCLEILDKGDLELIRLRYESGDAVASVAEQLGRSAKTVYRSLARIHELLMNCIQRRLAAEETT